MEQTEKMEQLITAPMELWFSEANAPGTKFSIKIDRQLYHAQSDFQRIDIFESGDFGRFLALDGFLQLTEKDEFIYHDMITHIPMAVHKEARDILVIGAGDGGVLRELCRYDRVRKIDMVEIDKMVVDVCKQYLPQTACKYDDPRLNLYFEDGIKFISGKENEYDVIIVDSTDPIGPGEGLFTKAFYDNCVRALREDGVMINQHESPFYEGDAMNMRRAHKRIVQSFPLSRVYQAHIPTYASGHWLFGFASKKYHPVRDFDPASWKKLGLKTKYYTPTLHVGCFALPAYVEQMLRDVE